MTNAFDVVVLGAGPAGVMAALRAGDLGARTALVTAGEFGGMAANDGPVPVRTLAHAARLLRESRQLGLYGIAVGEPVLDYPRLLERVRGVVEDVRRHSALQRELDAAGVRVYERCGPARFTGPHALVTASGIELRAEKAVVCTGGTSRRLSVPGAALTATHSDAWALSAVPPSMLVIGAGATGVQVASIFRAFGTRVALFEAGRRILSTEDADVSAAMATAFREAGIEVHESFGVIERFEKTPTGIRMIYSKGPTQGAAEAALAVVAAGWTAHTTELNLRSAGVEASARGFVRVDEYLRTSARHVFAAGDVTGGLMLAPQALQAGFVAGTNVVFDSSLTMSEPVTPIGSFTDPEYAQAGLGEAAARERYQVVIAVVRFDSVTRAIMDGRTAGFCKLIADRSTLEVLGCHVVGERAVDIAQIAAIAIAAKMKVTELARVPLSFPTYAGILGRAAAMAAREVNQEVSWQASQIENGHVTRSK